MFVYASFFSSCLLELVPHDRDTKFSKYIDCVGDYELTKVLVLQITSLHCSGLDGTTQHAITVNLEHDSTSSIDRSDVNDSVGSWP